MYSDKDGLRWPVPGEDKVLRARLTLRLPGVLLLIYVIIFLAARPLVRDALPRRPCSVDPDLFPVWARMHLSSLQSRHSPCSSTQIWRPKLAVWLCSHLLRARGTDIDTYSWIVVEHSPLFYASRRNTGEITLMFVPVSNVLSRRRRNDNKTCSHHHHRHHHPLVVT